MDQDAEAFREMRRAAALAAGDIKTTTTTSSTIGSILQLPATAFAIFRANNEDAGIMQRAGQTVKVKLHSAVSGETVSFDIQPDSISEQGAVIYQEHAGIRHPSSIIIYEGTPARTFGINAMFLSRTKAEAKDTFRKIHLLKSWRMPKKIANVPEILQFEGLGLNIKTIPTVLISFSIDISSDSDLINFGGGVVLPIVTKVSIQLKEAHTAGDMKRFNRDMFSKGQLPKW